MARPVLRFTQRELPARRLGARRWQELGHPGNKSSGAVGTDTDSLTAREGATPENALGADQRKRSAPPRKGVAPSLA
jgi:hypothetical protein